MFKVHSLKPGCSIIAQFSFSFLILFCGAANLFANLLYDPSTQIYVGSRNSKEQPFLVYPDGSVERVHSDVFLMPPSRSKLITNVFDYDAESVQLPFGSALDYRNVKLLKLNPNGRHEWINPFDMEGVDCVPKLATDLCLVDRFIQNFDQFYFTYYKDANSQKALVWNGSQYTKIPQELWNVEFFDIGPGRYQKKLAKIGSNRWVRVHGSVARDANPLMDDLFPGGKNEIHYPWLNDSETQGDIEFVQPIGNEIYIGVNVLSGTNTSLRFLKIYEKDGKISIEQKIVPASSEQVRSQFLGMDVAGKAYFSTDNNKKIYSLTFEGENKVSELASCDAKNSEFIVMNGIDPSFSVQHILNHRDAVWTVCHDTVWGFYNGKIVLSKKFTDKIDSALIVGSVDDEFHGIAYLANGVIVRYDGDRQTVVDEPSRLQFNQIKDFSSDKIWDDGQRFCRSLQHWSGNKARTQCFENEKWQDVLHQSFSVGPSDIYESQNFTWALTLDEKTIELWRRERSVESTWKKIALTQVNGNNKPPSISFVPTSRPDGIVIFHDELGFLILDDQNNFQNTNFNRQKLIRDLRPAYSFEENVLYGFCKNHENSKKADICALADDGRDLTLKSLDIVKLKNSGSGFIPLRHGFVAQYDLVQRVNEQVTGFIVRNKKFIWLSSLFGELGPSEDKNSFTVATYSLANGEAMIEKTNISTSLNSALRVRKSYFRTDGRQIVLERTINLASFDDDFAGSIGGIHYNGWPSLRREWQSNDGLWRRIENISSVPFINIASHFLSGKRNTDKIDINVLSASRIPNGVVLGTSHGFWICAANSAPIISELAPRLPRHRDCKYEAFTSLPEQVEVLNEENSRWLIKSGKQILRFNRSEKSYQVFAEPIFSQKWLRAGDQLWFANEENLVEANIFQFVPTRSFGLPAQTKGSDVILGNSQYLCAKNGLYSRGVEKSSWDLLFDSCKEAASNSKYFVAVSGNDLVICSEQKCEIEKNILDPDIKAVHLGFAEGENSTVLMGQGRSIKKIDLQSKVILNCKPKWLYGDLPRVDVKGFSEGFLVTKTGGVYDHTCEPEDVRLYLLQ